jgi:hypothetical protein
MTLEDRLTEVEQMLEDIITAIGANGDSYVANRVRAHRDTRKKARDAQQGGPQS